MQHHISRHVTTYYYVGFCYIMLRHHPDAIRTFATILNFIMRMRQYHTRSYQYDQVGYNFLISKHIIPYLSSVDKQDCRFLHVRISLLAIVDCWSATRYGTEHVLSASTHFF